MADWRTKIAALLAKAEGTDNENERDTYVAKAEELMVKWGIERAELESIGQVKPEEIIEVHRDWKTIYAPTMGLFAYTIGLSYGNLSFLQSRSGSAFVRTYIIGHKTDVESFLMLLDSLNLQVWTAVKAYRKETREARRWHTIHENFVADRSFIEGYGNTVATRLYALKKETEKTASTGAALVLVGKMSRVRAWQAEKYPNTGKARASSRQWSSEAASAGRTAGQKANLGDKGIGQRGALTS